MSQQDILKQAYAYGVTLALQEAGMNKQAAEAEAVAFTREVFKTAAYSDADAAEDLSTDAAGEEQWRNQQLYEAMGRKMSPREIALSNVVPQGQNAQVYEDVDWGQTKGMGVGALIGGGLGAGAGALAAHARGPSTKLLGGKGVGALMGGGLGALLGGAHGGVYGRTSAIQKALEAAQAAKQPQQ